MNQKSNYNIAKVIVGALLAVVVVVILTHAVPALAQVATDKPTNGQDGGFVICGNTADNPCQIGHLFAAFVVIINYLIAMAGFVAVAAIVYAGFMMIYSQGQDQLKTAKGRFSGAIIGLVLVAAAYVIINSVFTGKLSVGVVDGTNILSSPLEYIEKVNGK
jgi:hypothetical protein